MIFKNTKIYKLDEKNHTILYMNLKIFYLINENVYINKFENNQCNKRNEQYINRDFYYEDLFKTMTKNKRKFSIQYFY